MGILFILKNYTLLIQLLQDQLVVSNLDGRITEKIILLGLH